MSFLPNTAGIAGSEWAIISTSTWTMVLAAKAGRPASGWRGWKRARRGARARDTWTYVAMGHSISTSTNAFQSAFAPGTRGDHCRIPNTPKTPATILISDVSL